MSDLGEKIRKYRLQKKLTQEDLAGKLGVDYSHIGKIERGESGVSLKLLKKIMRVLGMKPKDIL